MSINDYQTALPVNLAEYLMLQRKRAGLTILELSAKSGVNRNTLAGLESGKLTNARMDTLLSIFTVLGIEIKLVPKEKRNE